ncbi:ABC transporter ATP-binding protein [Wenzhouxiangella sediminis]|uniref:ATP-binding cassette domain-containing protein n=1 Tax=Wenzhouxiangella sediminis TaxID=1792836 RepID=A0A3E1K5Q0_9GAMM|nr:ATP-binding cassette domain-containing protein [Wenzhouxiangella sediminis]RFF29363.1 ATP-binding cassette domain-containing protein [Wenzhouxiangella sediminis]
MQEPALQLEGVSIGALSDIDLAIAPGEVVCLSGPSGSGKSRLLRAVADLEAHGGRIRLGDRDQAAMHAHAWRRAVMLVPAESQWWHERVGEHFARDMPETLAELGFEAEVVEWSISRLSSGEKQRLALVRALSYDPEALLLDEPTANLDAQSTARVETWLTRLIRERRLPVLWVAHDPSQIERVGSRHLRIAGDRLESAL